MATNRQAIVILLIHIKIIAIHSQCSFYAPGPITIEEDKVIGNIALNEIMEISFNLIINSPCYEEYCNIFSIYDRYPSIYTHGDNITVQFRANPGIISSEIPDGALLIDDGESHNIYVKESYTQRIVEIDGLNIINITGDFNHSNYLHLLTDITTVSTDPSLNQSIHNGTISNLCISSFAVSSPPTIHPTIVPTINPSVMSSSELTQNPSVSTVDGSLNTILPINAKSTTPNTPNRVHSEDESPFHVFLEVAIIVCSVCLCMAIAMLVWIKYKQRMEGQETEEMVRESIHGVTIKSIEMEVKSDTKFDAARESEFNMETVNPLFTPPCIEEPGPDNLGFHSHRIKNALRYGLPLTELKEMDSNSTNISMAPLTPSHTGKTTDQEHPRKGTLSAASAGQINEDEEYSDVSDPWIH